MTPSRVGIDIDNQRRNWRQQKRRQRAAKRGSVMKCVAMTGGSDQQCRRNARTDDGYCYQHSELQHCTHLGCARLATVKEGGRLLCRAHAPLWRAHNRIVQRILSIPPRP